MDSVYKILKKNESLLVDSTICSSCKGACCKNSACDYLPADIPMYKKDIIKLLKSKKATIASNVVVGVINEKITSAPMLYIKAREVGKGDIDLISFKTSCSHITENGCGLDKKPSGALLLIPGPGGLNGTEETRCKNLIEDKRTLVMHEWLKHQKLLTQIVEYLTNDSFENLYRYEIINAANRIIEAGNKITQTEYEVAQLLEIMGIYKYLVKVYKDTTIEKPTPNIVNVTKPNSNLIRQLINNDK